VKLALFLISWNSMMVNDLDDLPPSNSNSGDLIVEVCGLNSILVNIEMIPFSPQRTQSAQREAALEILAFSAISACSAVNFWVCQNEESHPEQV
jgi:hypothetical protein